MNAERLYALAMAIHEDLLVSKLTKRLSELHNAVQRLAGNPQDSALQTQVGEKRKAIADVLSESQINRWPPLWSESLKDLGIAESLGTGLLKTIDEVINRNGMTPAVAAKELNELKGKVDGIEAAVSNLVSGFAQVGISQDRLGIGECEIGILIPRPFVRNRLEELGTEFRALDRLLEPFAELATGTREGFQVRAIASSEFNVFLESSPAVCACVALAIERIVGLYKQFLEIRKLRSELAKQQVPDAATQQVADYVDGLIAVGTEKIADDLIMEYRQFNKDEGRTNELRIEVRGAVRGIALRIDQGFNIEVTANAPAKTGDEETKEQLADRKAFERIEAATEAMKFIRAEGEPLLKLSDAKNESGEQDRGRLTSE
jgi:hypothetical protein